MIDKIDDNTIYNIYKLLIIVLVLSISFTIGTYVAHIQIEHSAPVDNTPTAHELLDRIP